MRTRSEIPMLFALANGVVLFDKTIELKQLISKSKEIIQKGPSKNERWENERYRVKKRADLTEIYLDLLDIDDEISFNYVASLLITNIIPILLENNNSWPNTRKKTISYLKSECYDGYKYIEILLCSSSSLSEKRIAAENLIENSLKSYGGILKGEAIVFEVKKL